MMNGTNTLVLAIPKPCTNSLFNGLEGIGAWFLAGAKADKQVIGLVALGSRVELLGRQHFINRRCDSPGSAIRNDDLPKTFRFFLLVGDVVN